MGAGRVLLKPAAPGTGVIAGGAARAILEEAGIHDVLVQVARLVQPHQRGRATIAGLKGAEAPRRDRPAARPRPEEFVPKGLLERLPRDRAGPARRRPDEVALMAELKVTQVRSAIGAKPKHRGTLRALGLRGIGQSEHPARPSRDPGHDRPGPPPRDGRGRPGRSDGE